MSQYTILTPTHNRPAFLSRMLHFFSRIHVDAEVLIVDSSRTAEALANQDLVAEYGDVLRLQYVHHDLGLMEKCCAGLAAVRTPFVTFCADDDFLFPAVINDCVQFLKTHADYTTAQGRVIHVTNSQRHKKTVYDCHLLNARDIADGDPRQRFSELATRPYSTFYAVYHTSVVKRSFDVTRQYTDYQAARVFTEAMLIGLSAIAGKIRVLPGIHYIQETHGENESRVLPRIADRNRRQELYLSYKDGLVREFVAAGVSEIEAAQLVDDHVNVTPGMPGARRLGALKWQQKCLRELRRIGNKTARLAEPFLRRNERFAVDERPVEIRHTEIFPDRTEYQIARDLLVQYPLGMSLPGISNQTRKSA
ncbi:MAG: TIGR00180 family glycosyltransferase [Planctomycetaceae bacterium]